MCMVSHTDVETQDLASLQICNKSWQVFERVCVGVFTVILFVGFYGMILLNVDYTDENTIIKMVGGLPLIGIVFMYVSYVIFISTIQPIMIKNISKK